MELKPVCGVRFDEEGDACGGPNALSDGYGVVSFGTLCRSASSPQAIPSLPGAKELSAADDSLVKRRGRSIGDTIWDDRRSIGALADDCARACDGPSGAVVKFEIPDSNSRMGILFRCGRSEATGPVSVANGLLDAP